MGGIDEEQHTSPNRCDGIESSMMSLINVVRKHQFLTFEGVFWKSNETKEEIDQKDTRRVSLSPK